MTFNLSKVCAGRLRERMDFEALDTYADETISNLKDQLAETDDLTESNKLRGAIQQLKRLKALKTQVENILSKP